MSLTPEARSISPSPEALASLAARPRDPSLIPLGPILVPKRLVWVLSWGAPPTTTMPGSTSSSPM